MDNLTLITCPRCGDAFIGDTFYCPYCERLRIRKHTLAVENLVMFFMIEVIIATVVLLAVDIL